MLAHEVRDAVHAVFIALVAGFRKAVGVEEERVTDPSCTRVAENSLSQNIPSGRPVDSMRSTQPCPTTIAGQWPAL